MRFQKQTLKENCPTIDVDFELELSGSEIHVVPLLIARVSGEYRGGSAGAPDAAYIGGLCRTAIDLWDARAVLLDLRNLKYEWGDEFDSIYSLDVSLAVVVGEKCRKAMSTLYFGEDTDKDITELEYFFDEEEPALEWLM